MEGVVTRSVQGRTPYYSIRLIGKDQIGSVKQTNVKFSSQQYVFGILSDSQLFI